MKFIIAFLSLAILPLFGQVRYDSNENFGNSLGTPWRYSINTTSPDRDQRGWFYNLGVTGIRVQFYASNQKELYVRHVLAGSPALGIVAVGDWIIGVNEKNFVHNHWRSGHHGSASPVGEFATALEEAQSSDGIISVRIRKSDGSLTNKLINVGTKYGSYSDTFPIDCPKSDLIRQELVQWLMDNQDDRGEWGWRENVNLAGMALLSDGSPESLVAAEKIAQRIAATTYSSMPNGDSSTWYYTQGGMYLAEYYLATGEEWVIPQLSQIGWALLKAQYRDVSQIASGVNHSTRKPTENGFGGWGHNPGFEGYGPIGMITAQGAITLGLMRRCGSQVDDGELQDALRASMAYLEKATWSVSGSTGKTIAYGDLRSRYQGQNVGPTGATALACFVNSPLDQKYANLAPIYSIGIEHIKNKLPDNHASSTMGMAYPAAGAFVNDSQHFRSVLDANKWWFTLAQCHDQSFYLQPNLDPTSKYSAKTSRYTPTAATAFIFSLPRKNLAVSGSLQNYDQWASHFPAADLIAPRSDFDQDGISNHNEWLWGSNPTKKGSSTSVTSYKSSSNSLTYTRGESAGSQNLYTLWSSPDLENWTEEHTPAHQVTHTDDLGIETVEIQLPTDATSTQKFYRIGVSEKP